MPQPFHDVRLSDDVEQGAKGGPSFKTTILGALSGREQRNLEWQYARHQWNIGYGIADRDRYMEVVAFFYARRGRGYAFRFKDWTDYTSGTGFTLEGGDLEDNRVLIAVGDGAEDEFQLYKFYEDTAATYIRKITRPIGATVRIWLDGVEQTVTTDFVVDADTGLVTFNSPPGDSVEIEAYFEFDVPVRFDIDHLDVEVTWWNAAAVPDIQIIEVRE